VQEEEALKSSDYRRKYRQFIARLREAREDAGLTQVQAAQEMGRPQSFISKCESGERRVDAVELQEFARMYGKDMGFFLG
jgi:transcriptional regulator with XRE-family HTH domain